MALLNKLKVGACAFAYMMTALTPAMADDTEIYLGGTGGGGGEPNVLLLIDTSGSMQFPMYDTYPTGHPKAGQTVPTSNCTTTINTLSGCATNIDDRRISHLKEAVRRLLENLNGDIRVGVSRYNSDSNGGRMIYPVRRLDDKVSAGTTEDRSYRVGSSVDDAYQLGSSGASLQTVSSALPIGNMPTVTVAISAQGTAYQQDSTNTTVTNAAGTPLGAVNTSRRSSVGIRFEDVDIPQGAVIQSAVLRLRHYNTGLSLGSGPSNLSAGAFNVTVGVQDSVNAVAFGTTSNRPNNRTYYSTGAAAAFTKSFASGEMLLGSSTDIPVTGMMQTLVDRGDWSESVSDVAFRLLGTAVYNNSALVTNQNARLMQGTGTTRPELIVTYNMGGFEQNYTGLRFTSVDIPKDATINSAFLDFKAASSDSGTANWQITMDPAVNAAAFDSAAANHLDGTRWTGGASVSHTPPAWVAGNTYSVNVTSLVQTQVNNGSYCGGTNMAFRIREQNALGTTTRRHAVSYDGEPIDGPVLRVNYTLPAGSTCLQASRAPRVRDSVDDAMHVTASGVQTVVGTELHLHSDRVVGLRFRNISVPQGAVIRSAQLRLRASNTPSSTRRGSVTVNAAALADVVEFSDTNKVGSMPATAASVSWSLTGGWSANNSYTSPDLKTVIQEVVNQAGWDKGNALALRLRGSLAGGGGEPRFYQVDNGASTAAELSIVYEATDPDEAVRRVRQDLIEVVNNLAVGGGTPLGESYYESALYMMGMQARYGRAYSPVHTSGWSLYPESASAMNSSNTYQTPIDGGQCQSNNIVMLTDGAPSNDGDDVKLGSTACSAGDTNSWDCMYKTAKFMKDTGYNTGAGFSPINTYSIGFGPDVADTGSTAYQGLSNVAKLYGGGDFFSASDSNVLASSFETIFARIADTNGTMAAPGVAVNQLNRSQHLDQLYYGVFKPAQTKRWVGNLKRYRLGLAGSSDAIIDATGANAIDSATTFFSTNARSWWSPSVDGNNADKGGAASKQTAARKIYVDSGSAGAMTLLDPANPPAGMTEALAKWVQGIDVDDDNGDGSSTDARQTMGAPVHAQPTLVSYGASDEDFVVFVGTNDGLLHSINVSDGSENWAWLPSDLIGIQSILRSNPGVGASAKPQYGLDGNWTVVRTATDTLLVGGMRQGGSNIYAIKLPLTKGGAPELKWVIKPSTSSNFADLGYTWSQPVQAKVRVAGVVKDVLVFGGGLDYDRYELGGAAAVSAGSDKGRQVFMVNTATGALEWMATNSGTTSASRNNVPAMKYSVPGSVRTLDKNADGLADHIYFGDTGGQIFRIDIDNSSSAPKLVKRVHRLATLGLDEAAGKANDRRFYEAPAAAYVEDANGKIYAAVAVGSGNRNFPKSDKTTQERFFVIRDYDAARFDILKAGDMTEAGAGIGLVPNLATASAPFGTADLADVTSSIGAAATTLVDAKKGWYINMGGTGRAGEKVLSASFLFSRYDVVNKVNIYEVSFNSFLPDSGVAAACSPVAGSTTAWRVLLANGSPAADLNNSGSITSDDRRKDGVATGITGSDVGLIRENADGRLELKKISGTNPETVGLLPPGFGRMLRTRWYDQQQ